jgi:metal-responsive CopG/Arc/MetJ family transcriptional regulator
MIILTDMGRKERMTVTVDAELIEEGNRAVKAGEADSLSSWVNDALVERSDRQRRLRGMAATIAAYEREHGVMTDEEMLAQARADQKNAIVVRGRRGRISRPRGGGPKAA